MSIKILWKYGNLCQPIIAIAISFSRAFILLFWRSFIIFMLKGSYFFFQEQLFVLPRAVIFKSSYFQEQLFFLFKSSYFLFLRVLTFIDKKKDMLVFKGNYFYFQERLFFMFKSSYFYFQEQLCLFSRAAEVVDYLWAPRQSLPGLDEYLTWPRFLKLNGRAIYLNNFR